MAQTALDFSDYISDRTRDFTGREWIFAEIDRWLADPDAPRYFIITGEPGIGKSTVAARLTQVRTIHAHHFCMARGGGTLDPIAFVHSLNQQLAHNLPDFGQHVVEQDRVRIDVDIDIGEMRGGEVHGVYIEKLIAQAKSADEAFQYLVREPLKAWAASHSSEERVVLLVDALDEAARLDRYPNIVDLIDTARDLSNTVKWVLTSRPSECLDVLPGMRVVMLDDSAENMADVRAYVTAVLAESAVTEALEAQKAIVPAFGDELVRRSGGNFLYLRYVLNSLQRDAAAGRSLKSPHQLPVGLDGVYREFLDRVLARRPRNEWRRLYRPVLGMLTVAFEALDFEQLTAPSGVSPERINDVVGELAQFLDVAPAGEATRYRIYHTSFIDFLTDRARNPSHWIDSKQYHDQLADYYGRYAEHWGDCDPYALRYLPRHLMQAGHWDTTLDLLSDRKFIKARRKAGMIDALVADIYIVSEAGKPLERILMVLVEAFRKQRLRDRSWYQLRTALNHFFGPYSEWPLSLQSCLKESKYTNVAFFLADTHWMEGRYNQALAMFEELRTIAEKKDAMGYYVAACVKLATVYENLGKPDQALDVLNTLICHPKAEEERSWYWWTQYHAGINLHKLGQNDCARNVLETVRERAQGDLAISALHQLGVIDLEEGKLEQAKEKFEQCLRERGDDEYNHRRAFEYRRLGQVYALMERFEDAQQAFAEAVIISKRCGDWRYVWRTRKDIARFVITPYLRKEQPETIVLSELAHRFDVEKDDLMDVFHLLEAERLGYLEVIDAESAEPTGQIVRWDVAHREDWWHTSVAVLIVDDKGNLALQQRGESHSRGRWDVSAAGHVDVGEDDISAVAREAQEELGIALSPERLIRFGAPYEFRKIGAPSVTYDVHESPTFLRYRTDKVNYERVSAFAAKVLDEEKQQLVTGRKDGALAVRWLQPADAIGESVIYPERFASAFKQLFGHAKTRERILREIRLLIGTSE